MVMHQDSARAVYRAARRAACSADAPLLLAVSGGLDSMALLSAMVASARRRIAAVATFDHGTGAAADEAVRHVSDAAAAASGLPVVVGSHGRVGMIVSEGREAAWRAARHRFLGETAVALGARVATAHTEDDQIETVLMRIMRGSGARGLAGLYADGPILRPFLGLRRAVLEAYMPTPAWRGWMIRAMRRPSSCAIARAGICCPRFAAPIRPSTPGSSTLRDEPMRCAATWRHSSAAFFGRRRSRTDGSSLPRGN